MRVPRHAWKTVALHYEMNPSVRNGIIGHSGGKKVEDRYIHLSGKESYGDAAGKRLVRHKSTEIAAECDYKQDGRYESPMAHE